MLVNPSTNCDQRIYFVIVS